VIALNMSIYTTVNGKIGEPTAFYWQLTEGSGAAAPPPQQHAPPVQQQASYQAQQQRAPPAAYGAFVLH
jgi:hypothetical protein